MFCVRIFIQHTKCQNWDWLVVERISLAHDFFLFIWETMLHYLFLIYMSCHDSSYSTVIVILTFTNLRANSADGILVIFFLFFFPENRIWRFIQIASLGDCLHEISNPIFWKK